MPRISFAQTLLSSQVVALASTMALIAALALSCTASQDAATTTTPADTPAPSVIAVATDAATADEAPTAPEDLKVFRMPTTPYLIPDPHHAFDAGSTQLVAELYSGLMRYRDYDDRIEVEGDLAESHSVSDDGLTYTFRLRNDLRYSDGSPVTAADFKWTWERALTEGTWERIFENLSPIQGAEALAAGDAETLTGVEVIDDRTLRVRLASPRYDFLMRMADPTAVVLSPANVANWGTDYSAVHQRWTPPGPFAFSRAPVGTGPFRLEEFDYFGESNSLHRNEFYAHGAPALGGIELKTDVRTFWTTPLEDLSYRVEPPDSLGQLWERLASGEISVLETDLDPRPYRSDGYSERWTAETVQSGFVSSFLLFNPDVEPFDDHHFRAALISAFDPTPFASQTAQQVPTGLAPSQFGRVGDISIQSPRDFSDATSILARSRYQDASSIVFPFQRGPEGEPVEFWHVFQLWQAILGIEVKQTELSAYSYGNRMRAGTLGMFPLHVKLVRPDPEAVYSAVAEALAPVANKSAHASNILDLIRSARHESDSARRRMLFEELEDYLATNALVVPVRWNQGVRYVTTQSTVHGLASPLFHGSRFAAVRAPVPDG